MKDPKLIFNSTSIDEITKAQILIIEQLSINQPYKETFEKVAEIICRELKWDASEYLEVNSKEKLLKNIFFLNYSENKIAKFQKMSSEISHTVGLGLPGKVWETKDIVWVEDYARQKTFPRSRLAEEEEIRTSVGIPIVCHNTVFGVFDFFCKEIKNNNKYMENYLKSLGLLLGWHYVQSSLIQELSEKEKKYKQIIETAEEGVCVIDANNKIILSNAKMQKILGCSESEMLGLTPFEFMDKENQGVVVDLIWEERYGEKTNQELEFIRKDNTHIWVNLVATGLFDENKNYIGSAAFIREITNSKIKSDELTYNKAGYDAMVQALSYGVIIIIESDIYYANAAVEKMLGLTFENDLKHTNIYKYVKPEHWRMVREKIESIKKRNEPVVVIEGKLLDNQKKNWEVRMTFIPISYLGKEAIEIEVIDISEEMKTSREIVYAKEHDLLTAFGNRFYLKKEVAQLIEKNKVDNQIFALLIVDIDQFKLVNNMFGYEVGDEVLKKVGERLRTLFNKENLFRFMGDQFAVLIENIESVEWVSMRAQELIDMFHSPFELNKNSVLLSPSIGICLSEGVEPDVESLLENCQLALGRAKEIGGGCFQFANEQLLKKLYNRASLVNKILKEFQNDNMEIYFQPIVSTKTLETVGLEALLRLPTPEDSPEIAASLFISIADELGILEAYWTILLERCCEKIKKWQLLTEKKLYISLNLSAKQLRNRDLLLNIPKILQKKELEPSSLQLEITENIIIHYPKNLEIIISELKKMGVQFALDDFGSGYSSFGYLRSFVVNTLKIDKTFIDNIPQSIENVTIVKAMIALGHALGIKVIVEGVETQEQLDVLLKLNCDEIQGYYFSKPLSEEEVTKFLQKT